MFNKIRSIAIHPLFIYSIIFILECIPYLTDKVVVSSELPKVGDNFKSDNISTVYYYSGSGKYEYSSVECYFEHGNPSFATSYKEGGVKTIKASIADRIPLLGDMCGNKKIATAPKEEIPIEKKYFSFTWMMDNFSDISHVISYMLLAFSISYYFRSKRNWYLLAFSGCFVGGGVLEGVQHFFIVGRNASVDDQVHNSIGALIGIAIYWLLYKVGLKFLRTS